ncbi:hypothetical protein GHT06_019796 [Daphnia sinensis]|uniref:Uncharacterized protein n=1 Tax=Daphnia sinensis TaxID=1820382 RepID=A0AAD5LBB9_9CRUS|nr:hypothetical protein GHT06_019796 [Daphnia sinensis]
MSLVDVKSQECRRERNKNLVLICHNCRIWLALTVRRPAKGEIAVSRLVLCMCILPYVVPYPHRLQFGITSSSLL